MEFAAVLSMFEATPTSLVDFLVGVVGMPLSIQVQYVNLCWNF
jgi:hypothetical protein